MSIKRRTKVEASSSYSPIARISLNKNTFPIAITPHRPPPYRMEASPRRKFHGNVVVVFVGSGFGVIRENGSFNKHKACKSYGSTFQLTRKTMSPCAPEHLSFSLFLPSSLSFSLPLFLSPSIGTSRTTSHDSARFRTIFPPRVARLSRPSPKGRADKSSANRSQFNVVNETRSP